MVTDKAMMLRIQAPHLIAAVCARAKELDCDPRQLCLAIILKTFEGAIVDAVLDGEDPKVIAPRYGMKAPRGERGPRQQKVLNWAIRTAGPSGTFVCSFKQAARSLGLHIGDMNGAARSLVRRGDLIITRASHHSPSVWTIPPHLMGGPSV